MISGVKMAVPGMETGVHVFTALLSGLSAVMLLGLLYSSSPNKKMVRRIAVAFAVLVWITWIAVAPVYVNEYGADKAVIKSFSETRNAHSLGMETKEHIFYTGLILSLLVPIGAYTLNLDKPGARKLMMWLLTTLIIGFIVMDALGAWISVSAKLAWSMKTR